MKALGCDAFSPRTLLAFAEIPLYIAENSNLIAGIPPHIAGNSNLIAEFSSILSK